LEKLLQLTLNGLMAGAVLAVPAIGLTMIYAVLRFVNFAVAGHMAVGAFAGYLLNAWVGLPASAAVAGAFVAAGLIGILSDHLALRPLRGYSALTIAIASIALNLVLENVVRFVFGNDMKGYDLPLMRDWRFGELRIGPQQLQSLGLAVAIMAAMFCFLFYTRFGKAMRAVADNPDLARLKGIDPARIAIVTVFLGAGLSGVGGVLIGLDTSIDPLTGYRVLLAVFAAAVLGGLGSIPGAVVGALALGIAEELALIVVPATYRTAVGFAAILIMLTFRPRGILGERAT